MNASHQTPAALEVRDLRGGWGPTTIVQGVSLSIATGETISIVGRNGVGKTTLLELVAGRALRHAGQIWIGDTDYSNARTFRRSEGGLGYVPQEREVFPSLTVRENLSIAHRPGLWDEERAFFTFPGLARRARSMGWQLSGGEQQMLSIARALMGNPTILLLDEPTEGLAPVIVEQLTEVLTNITADRRLAVLLIEQRIDVVLRLSSRCLIMDRGHIVHEESTASLRTDPARLGGLMGFD
jgi:branched-chain amino acid transport system ATP-binding protein